MKKAPFKVILIAALIIVNLFLWWEILLTNEGAGILRVTFLDVGQGDAILIDDSYGNQILIDGGDGKQILEKLDKHLPFYDREIELVILTHPEYDHLGGILKVLEVYEVENFLYSGLKKDTKTYQALLDLLKADDIRTIVAKQGQDIVLSNGANLYILYPDEDVQGIETKYFNEYSVITKLIFGEFSLILTGDAGYKAEARLLSSSLNLKADVLKVGHHGSKYSTHPLFLMKVDPEVAVISVGQNTYGHPTEKVLERLGEALVLRTDINGDIKILTDGERMTILPQNP